MTDFTYRLVIIIFVSLALLLAYINGATDGFTMPDIPPRLRRAYEINYATKEVEKEYIYKLSLIHI